MDETLILRLFDDERRRLNDSDITLSSTRYVVRALGTQESWSGIVYYCFPAEETESIIEGEIAFFENLGREFEWKGFGVALYYPLSVEKECIGRSWPRGSITF